MSQVIIAGNTSGTITLQAPAVSGTTTLTLPAVTGTVLQSGTVVTEAQGGNGTTTGYYGFKNRIINGNFGINQRGVSGTVTLTAGSYGHDRFKAGASGCTYTFATSANITTLTISAGSLIQVIEGLNLESATYTLSFSGTAQGKIGAGSFSSSGVTGSVTGGSNLNIEFNTGTLSLAQLEKGSTATSFDYRPYGAELALCQRYYEKSYDIETKPATATDIGRLDFAGSSEGNQNVITKILYKVTKRTIPTMVGYVGAGTSGIWTYEKNGGSGTATVNFDLISQSSARVYVPIGTNWVVGYIYGQWTANAEL